MVLFAEGSLYCSFGGMGGLNMTDVRKERIPLLWSTVSKELALAKGFGFIMWGMLQLVQELQWPSSERDRQPVSRCSTTDRGDRVAQLVERQTQDPTQSGAHTKLSQIFLVKNVVLTE